MSERTFVTIRIWLISIITIAIWSLLIWNYFHGGVPRHHILANEDLPEISNGWGVLVLPLLAWFLSYRIQKRIFNNTNEQTELKRQVRNAVFGFTGGLIFGILLALFFTLGYEGLTGNLFLSVFFLALFFPVYRAEYLLGFVVAMTYTFGAVLPTGIGSILALIGAIIYLYIRSGILFVLSKFKPAE